MNKVFPRKWYRLHSRVHWAKGPWDGEPDREQWSDPMTAYPCLAIRSDIGVWAGYVGVYQFHPAFGVELENLPHVTWHCYTDEIHFIEPPPEDPNAVVDVDDPKGSILATVRMPDYLWWFGFDFAHGGDAIPCMSTMDVHMKTTPRGRKETYKDLEYVKKTCATIALELCRMSGTKTMDSTRQRVFAS
jgi:hypothetical protein